MNILGKDVVFNLNSVSFGRKNMRFCTKAVLAAFAWEAIACRTAKIQGLCFFYCFCRRLQKRYTKVLPINFFFVPLHS